VPVKRVPIGRGDLRIGAAAPDNGTGKNEDYWVDSVGTKLYLRRGGTYKIISGAPPVIGPAGFPVISRGVPFASSQGGSFGGNNAESNATDADYGSFWASVYTPAGNGPQWFAVDLNTVSSANKTSVWAIWKNRGGEYDQPQFARGVVSGSMFVECPRDYTLQASAANVSTCPADGDASWVTLATVTDNTYNTRVHTGLNLSTYRWFRIRVTAVSGAPGATDDVRLQIELRNAAGGGDDSILFYGDSITRECFSGRRPDGGAWVNIGPIENELAAATGRVAPVVIDAGFGGWHAADLDTNKATYVGGSPCKWVSIQIGTNDAHDAAVDLNTQSPSGVNSTYAQAFKSSIQSVIDYAHGLGKNVILNKVPWRGGDSFSDANVQIFNTIIDQLYAANPTVVQGVSSLYALFQAHQNILEPALVHPTWDNSDATRVWDDGTTVAKTGYEHMRMRYRDMLVTRLYT
jgi:lysophospholipase L1-like esterase